MKVSSTRSILTSQQSLLPRVCFFAFVSFLSERALDEETEWSSEGVRCSL